MANKPGEKTIEDNDNEKLVTKNEFDITNSLTDPKEKISATLSQEKNLADLGVSKTRH